MTNDQQKRLAQLEAKESKRRQRVKEYFARRKVKQQFYKTHFEKTAPKELKATLIRALENM